MKTYAMFRRLRTLLAALAGVVPLVAGCASSNKYAAPGGYQTSATTDSMLVLVEIRDRSAIQGDLEETAVLRSDVEAREERAKTMQAWPRMLAAQAELAKADGNEALAEEMKGRKQFAELEKKLLDRREDLRHEEVDLAKAEADYLKTSEQSYERELDLADLRSRVVSLAVPSARAAREFSQLEAEIRGEDKVLRRRSRLRRSASGSEQEIAWAGARGLRDAAKLLQRQARPGKGPPPARPGLDGRVGAMLA
jgi:hypothetical protein